MKICRAQKGADVFFGLIKGNTVFRLACNPFTDIIVDKSSACLLSEVKLLNPVAPSKVVCIGKNYYDHALEMKEGIPAEPLMFLKPSTAVIGPEDEIVYPPDSHRLDFEAELGVVIKKRCRNVQPGQAKNVILGYTCLNDVTARDLQKGDGQWTRGKGFDTFCPIGPWIETELDLSNTRVTSRLNGETKQDGNTGLMMHDVDKLIAYISRVMTLLPGDIIATGTPAGIGSMAHGDIIEVEVEGIGVLRNRVADKE